MIFLGHLVQASPMPMECVQTDNGTEFTKRFTKASLDEDLTLLERKLKELGIKHKKIRPFTPRHNGKVERSHRKDNERFYATHCFFSFEDFRKQLKEIIIEIITASQCDHLDGNLQKIHSMISSSTV